MRFYAEYLLFTYLFNEVLINNLTHLFFNYFCKKKVPVKVFLKLFLYQSISSKGGKLIK